MTHTAQGCLVLLVEDDSDQAFLGCLQLKNLGYSVVHKRTGEEAVEHVFREKEQPDVVLMDIELGSGMDGPEAARSILSRASIPIIFMSSHTEKAIVEKTEQITSFGYIVKGSHPIVLDTGIKMARRLFASMEELRTSQMKFSGAFQLNPSPTSINDFQTGQFLECNDAFLKILGYSRNEIIGKTPLDLNLYVHLDERAALRDTLARIGRIENFMHTIRKKSGETCDGLLSAVMFSSNRRDLLIVNVTMLPR